MQEYKEQQHLSLANPHRPIINQFLLNIKLSLFISLLRIIFLMVIYSYSDTFLCYSHISNTTNQKLHQPWNTMFYMIATIVDIISVLGDTSLLKFILKERKVLDEIANDIRNGEEPNGRPKGGPYQMYLSIYQMILTYKFRHPNHSSAYGVCRYMHFFSTFLVFGNMAMRQHQSFCTLFSYYFLWFFLFTIYISTYEIDIFTIQTSTGPYRKLISPANINRTQIKPLFIRWRRLYSFITAVSIIIFTFGNLYTIQNIQINQLVIFIMLSILINILTIAFQQLIIKNAQRQMQYHHNLYALLKSCTKQYEPYFSILISLNRISLLFLTFAFLSAYDLDYIFQICLYLGIFLLLIAQIIKYRIPINTKINLLMTKKIKDLTSNSVQQCPICLNNFDPDDNVTILPCSQDHIYHTICMKKWLKQKKQCPLCRFNLIDYLT